MKSLGKCCVMMLFACRADTLGTGDGGCCDSAPGSLTDLTGEAFEQELQTRALQALASEPS